MFLQQLNPVEKCSLKISFLVANNVYCSSQAYRPSDRATQTRFRNMQRGLCKNDEESF